MRSKQNKLSAAAIDVDSVPTRRPSTGAFRSAIAHTVPPLVFLTEGDGRAMPAAHGHRWVSWRSL